MLRTIPADVFDLIVQAEEALAVARKSAADTDASRGTIERFETFERQHAHLVDLAEQRRRWLQRHGPAVAEYQVIAGELAARGARRIASLSFDARAVDILGEPPSSADLKNSPKPGGTQQAST